MPRGAKGWPIDGDERPHRSDVLIACGFGLVFPTGFWIAMQFSRSHDKPSTPLLFAEWQALAGFLLLLVVWMGGRVKWTPTAVLWIPMIGRKQFVAFGEVRRMRNAGKLRVFDVGRQVRVPIAGFLHGGKHVASHRESIDGWLDDEFGHEVPPKSFARAVGAFRSIAYVGIAPAVTVGLLPVLVRHWGPRLSARLGLPPSQSFYLTVGLLVAVWAVTTALAVASIAVLRVRFGVDFSQGLRWRPSRRQWTGFEIGPPVATPVEQL